MRKRQPEVWSRECNEKSCCHRTTPVVEWDIVDYYSKFSNCSTVMCRFPYLLSMFMFCDRSAARLAVGEEPRTGGGILK